MYLVVAALRLLVPLVSANVVKGSVAYSLYTNVHPLYTRYTNRIIAFVSEFDLTLRIAWEASATNLVCWAQESTRVATLSLQC